MSRKKNPETLGNSPRKNSLEVNCNSINTRVLRIPELRRHGNTIYLCSYQHHRGLIKNPQECQARQCKHYMEIPVKDLLGNNEYKPFNES